MVYYCCLTDITNHTHVYTTVPCEFERCPINDLKERSCCVFPDQRIRPEYIQPAYHHQSCSVTVCIVLLNVGGLYHCNQRFLLRKYAEVSMYMNPHRCW